MGKIKVIQITHDLNIGGLQRVVADLALKIDKERFDVSVCVLRNGDALEGELFDHGIKIFKFPNSSEKVDYLLFLKLVQLFKNERPHLIHTHNTHPFTDGVTAAILADVPIRIHTDHARQFPDKKRYMFAEWVLSHFSDRIVAVSESTKANLIRYEKIRPERIQIVQNGIDGDRFQKKIDKSSKRKSLRIKDHSYPLLGYCGRLSPEKGISFLLRAFSNLVREFPGSLLLILGGGEQLRELEEEAASLNIENNISFLGPRLDVGEILCLLDVLILPSLREGLPLVLLEAMAASLPIVATDVGGNCQAVEEGLNGFLVPSGDVEALHAAIRKLILDERLRKQFGENALDRFNQKFSIRKMIRAYEEIYQDCFKRKKER